MSVWVTVLTAAWLAGAIAVHFLLKSKPPGDGKITTFRYLWVTGSLAGLALILTDNLGYAVNGLTISAMCFAVMIADHFKKETGSGA